MKISIPLIASVSAAFRRRHGRPPVELRLGVNDWSALSDLLREDAVITLSEESVAVCQVLGMSVHVSDKIPDAGWYLAGTGHDFLHAEDVVTNAPERPRLRFPREH